MRLATYNVEWFDALFDDQGHLWNDTAPSARWQVTRAAQTAALGTVFKAIDADGVLVIEAPDTSRKRCTTRALRNFAANFDLRQSEVATGFTNDTQQEIALLYDPASLSVHHAPLATTQVPGFDQKFHIDLDIDAARDVVRFSKPPLELAVGTRDGGHFQLIGAHLKSKAPHGARTRNAQMRQSIANRRKQLAQAIWLRGRIDQHLREGTALIVMGDLNDGPGLDEFEHLFGRSSVEIVMGDDLHDPHARQAVQRRFGATPGTARFYLKDQRHYLQALLDYIMLSPALMQNQPVWRIWHPFDDPGCWDNEDLRAALLTASDHFPVTVDLAI